MEHSHRPPLSTLLPATYPLTHGSIAGSQRINTGSDHTHHIKLKPPALHLHHHDLESGEEHPAINTPNTPREKHSHRHLVFDTGSLDRTRLKHRHKHKHHKSRDGRLPRIMNPITSSTGARGLLWPGSREKETEADDGLLRPITRETTRSRWGSDSTTGLGPGSRKGSLFEEMDQSNKLGPVSGQEIRTMEDLDQVKDRRKQGEEFLRSALSLIGSLATDITRRLDYTYYNLLEKIAALSSTVASFQELSDSTSALFDDFEQETTGLAQEIRKQIGDLKEFQPQVQKIETLEQRMRAGRTRAEALNERLEAMRNEVDRWERREVECQTRINRRLRIFWAVVMAGVASLVVALLVQNWSSVKTLNSEVPLQPSTLANGSSRVFLHEQESEKRMLVSDGQEHSRAWSPYPSNLGNRHTSLKSASTTNTPTSAALNPHTGRDPFKMFDEL